MKKMATHDKQDDNTFQRDYNSNTPGLSHPGPIFGRNCATHMDRYRRRRPRDECRSSGVAQCETVRPPHRRRRRLHGASQFNNGDSEFETRYIDSRESHFPRNGGLCAKKKHKNYRPRKGKKASKKNLDKDKKRKKKQSMMDRRNKRGKRSESFESHALFDGIGKISQDVTTVLHGVDAVSDLAKQIGVLKQHLAYNSTDPDKLMDNALSRLEDFICYMSVVNEVVTWKAFVAATCMYVKTYVPGAIVPQVIQYIEDTFGKTQLEEHSSSFRFSDILTKWKELRHCALAKNLAHIFDIVVTLGVCPECTPNIFRLTEYKTFCSQAWDVQNNCLQFVEMVLSTVVFFLERGYVAVMTGDWSALLYEEDRMMHLDKEYAYLLSGASLVEAGRMNDFASLAPMGVEPLLCANDYERRVDELLGEIASIMKVEKGPMRVQLNAKYVTMSRLASSLILLRKKSCIREKPYSIVIFGASSVGKSMLTSLFTKSILTHNNLPSKKEDIVFLNEADKYQSEYRPHHTAVVIDDYGNTREDHYDSAPTRTIVDYANNVPKASLQAEAENKGKFMIEPKLFVITTNVWGLMAEHFSKCPVSIVRRFEKLITARLKDEYIDPVTGGPNPEKMSQANVPDAWKLRVDVAKIIRGKLSDQISYERCHEAEYISVQECMDMLRHDSELFYARQKKYVQTVEDLYDMDMCPHGVFHAPDTTPECSICSKMESHALFGPSKLAQEIGEAKKILPLCETSPEIKREVEKWFIDRGIDEEAWIDIAQQKSFTTIMREKFSQALSKYPFVSRALGVAMMALAFTKVNQLWNKHESHDIEEARPPVARTSEPVNVWKSVPATKVVTTTASATTTANDLIELVCKKLAHAQFFREDGSKGSCNILPLKSNLWLAPHHPLKGCTNIYVRTTPGDVLGKNFSNPICSHDVERIPGTDYAVVRLVSGGDNRDLTQFFPLEHILGISRLHGTVIYRDSSGSISTQRCTYSGVDKVPLQDGYCAYAARCEKPTHHGQCMAVHILDVRQPVILGGHLAGLTGQNDARVGCIYLPQLEQACEAIGKRSFVSHSSGTIRNDVCGIKTTLSPIRNRHCSLWMCDDASGHEPCLEVLGEHNKGKVSFRSSVSKSPISDTVSEVMGLPRIHGAPGTRAIYRHWHKHLDSVAHQPSCVNATTLKRASDDLRRKFFRVVDATDFREHIHPYDHDTVLAGRDGVAYVDRMDLSTSMGWPWNKAKTGFIVPSDRHVEGISQPLDMDVDVLQDILRIEQLLADGERVHFVHRANLKDEAVKFTKDKIRVFSGSCIQETYLIRKYFLSMIRFIQVHWKDLETAVGINAYGDQWEELAQFLKSKGENIFGGDYKAFDQKAAPPFTSLAWQLLIDVAEYCGYSKRSLRVMRGLVTEIVYPLYEHDGVMVQTFGSNPSGHPCTVIINNIVNSLYMRYVYYSRSDRLNLAIPDFDRLVGLICYGDDNVANPCDDAIWFTQNAVQEELGLIGIEYTDANKNAVDIPDFTPFEEISFLKRTFRYDAEVGRHMAPLEEASISKSLHNIKMGRNCILLPLQLSADSLTGAAREYVQHGREKYEIMVPKILEVATKTVCDKYMRPLPTWEQQLTRLSDVPCDLVPVDGLESHSSECRARRFDSLTQKMPIKALIEADDVYEGLAYFRMLLFFFVAKLLSGIPDADCFAVFLMLYVGTVTYSSVLVKGCLYQLSSMPAWAFRIYHVLFWFVWRDNLFEIARGVTIFVPFAVQMARWETRVLGRRKVHPSRGAIPLPSRAQSGTYRMVTILLAIGIYANSIGFGRLGRRLVNDHISWLHDSCRFYPNDDRCLADLNLTGLIPPQAHNESSVPWEIGLTTIQNIQTSERVTNDRANITTFSAKADEWDYTVPTSPDATFATADDMDCCLNNFFERPIKVASYAWTPGVALFEQFNPWKEYFENPRVINRINNFNLLRAKLCVKFVLNGNGFYYGRLICDYLPLDFYDQFTRRRATVPQDAISASQRPHVYLDPTLSLGGDLCLPFVWHHNALRIPLSEWDQMGSITLRDIVPLAHTNGSATPINVSVFVWAEDVVLSVPTSNNSTALVSQSEEENHHALSIKASIASKAIAKWSNVPYIGKYALASSMAASTASSIASLFGYSRPIRLETDMNMRNTPFGQLATCNTSEIVEKLTTDAKQEVSIDTRVVGLDGTDEMSIASIISRESYLTSFQWAAAEASDSHLFSIQVTPTIWDQHVPDLGVVEKHMPACCAGALPFKYWRGTMRYRFQVVSSAFHKGRIRFVYEPHGPTSGEWNLNYTHVVDIAEERDFTLDVGWGSAVTYCETKNISTDGVFFEQSPVFAPFPFQGDTANGQLSVYVVNELTTTGSIPATIQIMVHVSALPDMQLAVPDDSKYSALNWVPNPADVGLLRVEGDDEKFLGFESHSEESNADAVQGEGSKPIEAKIARVLGVPPANAVEMQHVVFGESITSIRSLMKRYCHTTVSIEAAGRSVNEALGAWNFLVPDYPGYPGYVDSGNALRLAKVVNFGKTSFLHYFTPMFVCRRGSIRHRLVPVLQGATAISVTGTHIVAERQPNATTENVLWLQRPNLSWMVSAAYNQIGSGGLANVTFLNPVLSYETPFYVSRRYYNAKYRDVNRSGIQNTFTAVYLQRTSPTGNTNGALCFQRSIAAGDDYSLSFFTGAPIGYWYTVDAAPPP